MNQPVPPTSSTNQFQPPAAVASWLSATSDATRHRGPQVTYNSAISACDAAELWEEALQLYAEAQHHETRCELSRSDSNHFLTLITSTSNEITSSNENSDFL